jgi:hypothetical protein
MVGVRVGPVGISTVGVVVAVNDISGNGDAVRVREGVAVGDSVTVGV